MEKGGAWSISAPRVLEEVRFRTRQTLPIARSQVCATRTTIYSPEYLDGFMLDTKSTRHRFKVEKNAGFKDWATVSVVYILCTSEGGTKMFFEIVNTLGRVFNQLTGADAHLFHQVLICLARRELCSISWARGSQAQPSPRLATLDAYLWG